MVGMDPISGRDRFVYEWLALKDGIGVISVAIGMFGVTEILETIGSSVEKEVFDKKIKGYWPTRQDWKDSWAPIGRGTVLGFFLEFFPDSPPDCHIPELRHREKVFQTSGTIRDRGDRGRGRPEACNNAAATAGYVPLFSLGIPSNALNAVLLGALMIYGLQPGPLLIKSNPTFFWGCSEHVYRECDAGGFKLASDSPVGQGVRIPYTLLSVLILIFSFLGAYSIHNDIDNVLITFAFGILGYFLKKYDFERPPLVLAFVLGPLIEKAFRQSMIFSDGSFTIFFTRPISAFSFL